jgi:uncharacterized protein YaiL (DUF2058 family)
MASLRDQLVAKGLATAKDQQRVDREKKEARKRAERDRAAVAAEAERRAAEAAEEARQAVEARLRARKEAEIAREAAELPGRIRNIVNAHRLGARGDVRFFHKDRGGLLLRRMEISEAMAWRLRAGQAGIVWADALDGTVSYVIVGRQAVERIEALAPDRVVFFVRDTEGISQPAEAFAGPKLDVDLRPRRFDG